MCMYIITNIIYIYSKTKSARTEGAEAFLCVRARISDGKHRAMKKGSKVNERDHTAIRDALFLSVILAQNPKWRQQEEDDRSTWQETMKHMQKSHWCIFLRLIISEFDDCLGQSLQHFGPEVLVDFGEAIGQLILNWNPVNRLSIDELLCWPNINQRPLALNRWIWRWNAIMETLTIRDQQGLQTRSYSMRWDSENQLFQSKHDVRNPAVCSASCHGFCCKCTSAHPFRPATFPAHHTQNKWFRSH